MFTLYIDRLKGGKETEIDEENPPQFLDIENDTEIAPESPVKVEGRAYLAGEWLVIHASISTTLRLSCALCNEPFSYPIQVSNWIHEEAIGNIKSGVFSYAELIREAILLEVPFFSQCAKDHCSNSNEIKKYMNSRKVQEQPKRGKKKSSHETDEPQGYQPFKDLSWEES